MRSVINASLIVLALGVGLAACDRADEGRRSEAPGPAKEKDKMAGSPSLPETPAAKSDPSAAKTDTKMSDSDLENAVKAKLSSDEQLRSADLKVDADADKNEVTISGTVKSEDERSKAIELAKTAHSGVTINDKIDVKPAA